MSCVHRLTTFQHLGVSNQIRLWACIRFGAVIFPQHSDLSNHTDMNAVFSATLHHIVLALLRCWIFYYCLCLEFSTSMHCFIILNSHSSSPNYNRPVAVTPSSSSATSFWKKYNKIPKGFCVWGATNWPTWSKLITYRLNDVNI